MRESRSVGHCNASGFDPLAKAEMVGFFKNIDEWARLEADAKRLLQELDARTQRRIFPEKTGRVFTPPGKSREEMHHKGAIRRVFRPTNSGCVMRRE
jgi:hypothetical protein